MVECVNILRKCRDDFLVRFKKTINRIRYSNQPNNCAVGINVPDGHFPNNLINVQVRAGLINVH